MDAQALLGLWHGDPDTTGYQHYELVVAVCDLVKPPSVEQLRRRFYPAPFTNGKYEDPEIDLETERTIDYGYSVWRNRVDGRAKATEPADAGATAETWSRPPRWLGWQRNV